MGWCLGVIFFANSRHQHSLLLFLAHVSSSSSLQVTFLQDPLLSLFLHSTSLSRIRLCYSLSTKPRSKTQVAFIFVCFVVVLFRLFSMKVLSKILGVPKPYCFKPGCWQFLRRSALLRSFFAFFKKLLRTCVALFCGHLRSFALICVRPHLDQPHLRTAETREQEHYINITNFLGFRKKFLGSSQLGGHFGPQKKYLAPPPSPQTFPRRTSLSRTVSSDNPPPSPRPPPRTPPPFPPPRNRKKKKIRNVHQGKIGPSSLRPSNTVPLKCLVFGHLAATNYY